MELVYKDADWCAANKECREAFIKAMDGYLYGEQETLDAWQWFFVGFEAGDSARYHG